MAATALLGACAAPGPSLEEQRAALDARAPLPLSAVPFAPLAPGESAVVEFGKASEVILQDGRRTYVRGFAFPEGSGPLVLTVRATRAPASHGGGIVYPRVTLLDRELATVVAVPPDRFKYRVASDGEGLTADVFVDPAQRVRFVLLTERPLAEAEPLVTQTNVHGQIPIVVPVGAGFAMWFVGTASSLPEMKVPAAAAGRLAVRLEKYEPQVFQPAAPVRPR